MARFDEDKEYRDTYRHTTSHIMAHAVKRLYPDTLLAIGPAIESGFYYDFDRGEPFGPEDLKRIEDEMEKIVRERLPVERFELPRAEALQLMADRGERYKVELINDLPEDAALSFYRQGEFVDLCAGPHLENTGEVRAFRLLQTAGAYWRGNEKNKMLQRIYGTSFPDKGALKAYLDALEEARKRDHNKIGRELEYFTTVDYIGQGLPILLPKGAKVMQILSRFVEDEEERRGYLLTKTPFLAKSDLYKISGHWDHYRDGMFILGDPEKEAEQEVLALRPMTCPFQFPGLPDAHPQLPRPAAALQRDIHFVPQRVVRRNARADPCPAVHDFGSPPDGHPGTGRRRVPRLSRPGQLHAQGGRPA